MNHRLIEVGDRLTLKPERADAYGLARDTVVEVTAIATKGRYVTPWIYSGADAFTPSDFNRKVLA